MIHAIAVDDELPALSLLENFCKRVDFIELQKVFNKPNEALRYLQQFPVDLIFLDINMPALRGLIYINRSGKIRWSYLQLLIVNTQWKDLT